MRSDLVFRFCEPPLNGIGVFVQAFGLGIGALGASGVSICIWGIWYLRSDPRWDYELLLWAMDLPDDEIQRRLDQVSGP